MAARAGAAGEEEAAMIGRCDARAAPIGCRRAAIHASSAAWSYGWGQGGTLPRSCRGSGVCPGVTDLQGRQGGATAWGHA